MRTRTRIYFYIDKISGKIKFSFFVYLDLAIEQSSHVNLKYFKKQFSHINIPISSIEIRK